MFGRRSMHGATYASIAALCALCACVVALPARAAESTMTLVVAAAPGAGLDRVARLLAPQLEADFGGTVVIEYRPGEATRIASEWVSKAGPDGNTLLLTSGASTVDLAFNPGVRPNVLDDLAAVARVTEGESVFVVSAASPVRSIADLVARARAAPGALSYGSVNVQSTQRLVGELFKLRTGTSIVQIPYKAEGAILTQVLAGDLDFAVATIAATVPMVQAGKLRALAVSGPVRSQALPDVPTLAEAGVADVVVTQWYGLFVPTATPLAVREALARTVQRVSEADDYRESLRSVGLRPSPSTPVAFEAMLRRELAKFREIVDTAHLRPE